MKKLFMTLYASLIGVLTCCCQSWGSTSKTEDTRPKNCPISPQTTKITYSQHTNSGIARSTTFTILQDSLIWSFEDFRNNLRLHDSCKYPKEDFVDLVRQLSMIQFSAKDAHDYSTGGAGYACYFETDHSHYFSYNSYYKLSGDYEQVTAVISQFVNAHKTACELSLEKLSQELHERGSDFGEWETLPEELEKYKVE